MSDRQDGGPAFPGISFWASPTDSNPVTGMSLRDWFAGQALAGAMSSWVKEWARVTAAMDETVMDHEAADTETVDKMLARECFRIADAMIAGRQGESA